MSQARPDTTSTASTHSVSVLIITYNEEQCIADCIDSISWSDDIVVVDSISTDRTVEILRRYSNVRVVERPFDDFSSQRNFGLHQVEYKNAWVLIIDADETCPADLRDEILAVTPGNCDGIDAFRLRRTFGFLGSSLHHNSFTNVWLDRLVRPRAVVYHGLLHEKPFYRGGHRRLRNRLVHAPFEKGIAHWVQRRNTYSTIAACAEIESRAPLSLRSLLSADPVLRRQGLNALYRRLPCRWLAFFAYNVFGKLCFLDGSRGMFLVLMETYYEFLIVVKIREFKELARAKAAAARGSPAVRHPPY